MTKWRKGPWRAIPDGHGAMSIETPDDKQICCVRREEEAKLVAADPEIYEALDDLCSFGTELTQDKWDRAREILAKARGDS